jgi:hypothetical protein
MLNRLGFEIKKQSRQKNNTIVLEQAKQQLSSETKEKGLSQSKMRFTYCLGIYPICLKQQQTKK